MRARPASGAWRGRGAAGLGLAPFDDSEHHFGGPLAWGGVGVPSALATSLKLTLRLADRLRPEHFPTGGEALRRAIFLQEFRHHFVPRAG